jgi:hypothetical protein
MWLKVQIHSHASLSQGGPLGAVQAQKVTLAAEGTADADVPELVQSLALSLIGGDL